MKFLALVALMAHIHHEKKMVDNVQTQSISPKPPKVVIIRKHTGDRPKYLGDLSAPFLYSQLDNK